MDKIIIRDLRLNAIVGTFPKEKKSPQEIILNIELACEIRKAAESDDLADTVDYKAVKRKISDFVKKNKFNLIERIAEKCAEICLSHKGVFSVKITIDKPGSLSNARSAAVEISRHSNNLERKTSAEII
jgi:FolB domain-containing protein